MNSQIIVVTGGGSGIGRSVAQHLLNHGHTVIVAGRRLATLQETLNQSHNGQGRAYATDVTDPASVANLFENVAEEFGRVDVLFNNAGINIGGCDIDELSVEDRKQVVDVNLTGVFLCTQAAFQIMKRQTPQGGRIINNGSISAQVPRPNSIAYTATKHAVTGLTKSTALDGRKSNITCSQIDIGNAATDMTSRMASGVPQADGSLAAEPTMDVRNVAEAVRYMAELPLSANVPFMTVMATKMPLLGRG